jgi:hypothetical protein
MTIKTLFNCLRDLATDFATALAVEGSLTGLACMYDHPHGTLKKGQWIVDTIKSAKHTHAIPVDAEGRMSDFGMLRVEQMLREAVINGSSLANDSKERPYLLTDLYASTEKKKPSESDNGQAYVWFTVVPTIKVFVPSDVVWEVFDSADQLIDSHISLPAATSTLLLRADAASVKVTFVDESLVLDRAFIASLMKRINDGQIENNRRNSTTYTLDDGERKTEHTDFFLTAGSGRDLSSTHWWHWLSGEVKKAQLPVKDSPSLVDQINALSHHQV